MKFLKVLGILVSIVVIAMFVVSLMLPNVMEVERSRVMEVPADKIFSQINELKNWGNWSPWHKMDPDMVINYSNPSAGLGASYSWKSTNKNVGNGSLKIVESIENELQVNEMQFEGRGGGTGTWKLEGTTEGIKVSWGMSSPSDGMMEKLMSLVMVPMLEQTFDQGLVDLELAATAMPDAPKYPMHIETFPDQHYVGTRHQMTVAQYSTLFAANEMGEILEYVLHNGGQRMDKPMAIFHKHSVSEDIIDVEFALPVVNPVESRGKFRAGVIPGGEFIVGEHLGHHDELPELWNYFEDFIAENNLTVRWSPYEHFVTIPSMEPDTSKWLTNVVFPVE